MSAAGLASRYLQNTHRILGLLFPVIVYILEMLSMSTLNCMFIREQSHLPYSPIVGHDLEGKGLSSNEHFIGNWELLVGKGTGK